MSFKYFNVKNGLTTGNISLHSANANVQANYFIGNISVTGLANLGAVGNVKITGGTNGYVLSTDGTGNLSWASQGGSVSTISNGNSNVNIATANGNITFSAVGNANVMTITGTGANINGTANITGNVALSGANVSLGEVGNLHITGGANGYVLSTDGSGNLSWISAATAGSNIVIDAFTGNGVQTVFTLTNAPTSEDYTIINIDGVSQLHSAYTVAGANVTLSSAPAVGAAIEVMIFNLGGGGGGGSALTIQDEGSNLTTTASLINFVGNGITANATGNSVTVTVPGGGITAQDLLSPFLLMGA